MYRKVIEWISPDEAEPVTNQLIDIAEQVKDVSAQVSEILQNFDNTWSGGAKNRFCDELNSVEQDLKRFASRLELKAAGIAAASVMVEVEEWVDDIFDGD